MLDKTYDAQAVEARIYDAWEQSGAFECGRSDGRPYTIVIPPPTVTGSLHIGHALNNTLQDILGTKLMAPRSTASIAGRARVAASTYHWSVKSCAGVI
ncbi:MAG: class I tRNA ligase family protein, partial [Alphaproteobacteria bacterium]